MEDLDEKRGTRRFVFIYRRRRCCGLSRRQDACARAGIAARSYSITSPQLARARQSRSACCHAARRQAEPVGLAALPRLARVVPDDPLHSSAVSPRPRRRRESSSGPSMNAWRSRRFRLARRSWSAEAAHASRCSTGPEELPPVARWASKSRERSEAPGAEPTCRGCYLRPACRARGSTTCGTPSRRGSSSLGPTSSRRAGRSDTPASRRQPTPVATSPRQWQSGRPIA
jgi:hypothetical protein